MAKKDSNAPTMAKNNHDSLEPHADTVEGAASPDSNGFSPFGRVGADHHSDNITIKEPAPLAPDPFAAFDPAKLRIDQSFLNHGVAKKLLTTLPIRKPNKQDFIRVNPDERYRLTAAFIELKDDREVYLVLPSFAPALAENEYFTATIYLCINRQKVLSFWPVKLPGPDGRQMGWHTSAQDAALLAMKGWVRVTANMSLGAYEVAEAAGIIPDPEWPEQTMPELLSIAFKGRIIDGPEHPVMKRLSGEI